MGLLFRELIHTPREKPLLHLLGRDKPLYIKVDVNNFLEIPEINVDQESLVDVLI